MSDTTLQATKTKKVLIIEDEGEMCLLLNILLDDDEMELDHLKSLAMAKEYLEKQKPAVVLLDNKLPDGFGIDYISHIKQVYPDVKIIMISSYDSAAKDVALENGADRFLTKPFKKQELFDSIKELLY
ncbi:MAG: hypothetical protein C4308_07625 [Chitinophagaceae bacterium]